MTFARRIKLIHLPVGLLSPPLIPEAVRQDISMDFVEVIPKSEGMNVLFVVVQSICWVSLLISYPFYINIQRSCSLKTFISSMVYHIPLYVTVNQFLYPNSCWILSFRNCFYTLKKCFFPLHQCINWYM